MNARDDATSSAFDPAALAAHHRFVRRLAVGLVGDGDAADELTARAFAAALTGRPATGAGFRVWLARVTHRLFLRDRRERERRARRERIAALGEATHATVDLVAEMEIHRHIALAFEALEEPAKSALFLRYFRDLTPTAIAAELGVPLATVKSRLQRGLAQLRARLDAAHRGRREEWTSALLPWIGGPLVTTKVKLVPLAVAAVLVVGASLGGTLLWRSAPKEQTPDARSAEPATAAAPAAADGASAPAAPRAERTAVAPAPLPFASGVVVDERGAPIAGVDVVETRLHEDVYNEVFAQEPVRLDRLDRDRVATSDEAGRFVVPDAGSELATLLFLHDGFAAGERSEFAADRSRNQELRIVLHGGVACRGVVVDREGRPIVRAILHLVPEEANALHDARVAAHLPGTPSYTTFAGWQQTATDANGAFSFTSLASPRFRLDVIAGGYDYVPDAAQDVAATGRIVLRRDALLVDVADSDTHEPIDAAMIVTTAEGAAGGAPAETVGQVVPWRPFDADHSVFLPKGRLAFHFGGGPRGDALPPWMNASGTTALQLHVMADGYVGEIVDVGLAANAEPPHLQVELAPAVAGDHLPAISGRVVGARPTTRVRAYALLPGWSDTYLEIEPPLLATTCAADGGFALFDLPPGRFRIRADAPQCAPAWIELDAPARDVVLEVKPAAQLAVTVRDHDGHPVAGAVVHAQREDHGRAWAAKSDATGVALFDDLPDVVVRLVACKKLIYDTIDPRVVATLDPTVFAAATPVHAPSGARQEAEVLLLERRPVTLHFERDDGSPATRARLSIMNFSGPVAAQTAELGRLRPLHLEIDSRGDAEVELFAGHYEFEASETALKRYVKIDVAATGTARATVKLPALGPTGAIDGRVIDRATGAPLAQKKVFAWQADAKGGGLNLGVELTDDDGRFEFVDVPPGLVDLRVVANVLADRAAWSRPDPASPYATATRRITVATGAPTTLELALPKVRGSDLGSATVAFDLRVTDAKTGRGVGRAQVRVAANLDDTDCVVLEGTTDSDGRLQATIVAGGKYAVTVAAPPAGRGDDPDPPALRDRAVEVTPESGRAHAEVALERAR